MTRICPTCGKTLPKDAHHNAKYCSDACRREAKNKQERITREYLKAHGICVHCRCTPAKKGSTLCAMCTRTIADDTAVRRERYKENGKCQCCGSDTENGLSVCSTCLASNKQRQHRVYHERLAQGSCPICGKRSVTPGYKSCAICRHKAAQKVA